MSVLYVLGGWGSSVYHSSVEKYDVAGDAWTSVASMSQARRTFGSGVVFNSDGSRHLYVVGGQGPSGRLSSVEKYDPVSNAWTRVADLPAATANGKCGVLKHDDGKQYLYVVGGGSPNSELDSVLRYDPSVDTWTTVTSMASGRTNHGVGVIAHSDGKQYMYAVGGSIGGLQSADAERYDYATDSWTNIASMTRSYASTATAVLTHANNQQYLYVLNSGGANGATSYDSSTNTWTDIANSIVGRNYPGASALTHNDGTQHIYLGGGALQNTVERFDLALGTWTALATWANIRYGPSLVTIPEPEPEPGPGAVGAGADDNAGDDAELSTEYILISVIGSALALFALTLVCTRLCTRYMYKRKAKLARNGKTPPPSYRKVTQGQGCKKVMVSPRKEGEPGTVSVFMPS